MSSKSTPSSTPSSKPPNTDMSIIIIVTVIVCIVIAVPVVAYLVYSSKDHNKPLTSSLTKIKNPTGGIFDIGE